MASDCRVEWSDGAVDDDWDRTLAETPGTHHEQTTRWGRLRSRAGWDVSRAAVREQGRLVAGALLLVRKVGPFGAVGYVDCGPFVAAGARSRLPLVIDELLGRSREMGITYLVIQLPYGAHQMTPHLAAAGFWRSPERFPPATMMAATAVIDLAAEPEAILARMRNSTRHNIRRGRRRGLSVREGTREDIALFHRLVCMTCRRRGEQPNPRRPEDIERLWDELEPLGWVRLTIAEHAGEPLCGQLAFAFSDTLRTWKFGWSGRRGDLKPSEALIWESILWARHRGFRYLDLVQVDPVVAKAVAAGASDDPALVSRRFYGPTLHKMGFGGELVFLPGTYAYVVNPLLRRAYTAFAAPLLRSEWGLRGVGLVAERAHALFSGKR